jgi:hypothetical protein
LNQKLLHKFKMCINFQVALMHSYVTKVTMSPACVEKYGFGISTSAFAVSAPWQVGPVGRKLGII